MLCYVHYINRQFRLLDKSVNDLLRLKLGTAGNVSPNPFIKIRKISLGCSASRWVYAIDCGLRRQPLMAAFPVRVQPRIFVACCFPSLFPLFPVSSLLCIFNKATWKSTHDHTVLRRGLIKFIYLTLKMMVFIHSLLRALSRYLLIDWSALLSTSSMISTDHPTDPVMSKVTYPSSQSNISTSSKSTYKRHFSQPLIQ